MNSAASDRCMSLTPADAVLRRQLGALSRLLSACLVGKISSCLQRSCALTDYELQLIRTQNTDSQKASQLLLTLLRKGSKACHLFFQCLAVCSPQLFEKVTEGTVKANDIDHYHFEDTCSETAETVPPYVINIHNSSLSNCIIGNNNGLCCSLSQMDDVSDRVEDMQRSDQQAAAQDSSEARNILVESSRVEFVIIGDNNYMNVGSSQDLGEQEQRESEPEDSEECIRT